MESLNESIKESLAPLKKFADENMDFTYTFAAIGLGYVGMKIAKELYSTYKYVLRPSRNLKKRYGDGWAVITGASDGIGKGFAFELAKRGFNVGLVGRDQEKLDKVAQEIKDAYKVETKTTVFDFNVHYTDDVIQELTDKLGEYDKVALLVNNVGVASYDPLEKMTNENIHKQINVNVVGTTVVTKIMIPKLLENERSGMLFVGSIAGITGLFPTTNLAVYSASKSYVNQFALSLAGEHKDKIDVLVTTTASVKSNMNSGRYLFTITPEQHAKHVLNKLGHDTISHGHYVHGLGYYFRTKIVEGYIINYINNRRKLAFVAEREKEKQQQNK